jgi:O-acetyl-ADP-ribose deacetylase (regulator of RNase III)
MVKVAVGNMFDSEAQTLVNTVNCVGVMGKGVALEFRKRFPDMYADYVRRCERRQVRLGRPYLYRRPSPPHILNFPTKNHWRSPSRLDDIIRGLDHLREHYREWGITSLAVPPLGSGHGQLEWRVVGPTLYRKLKELTIPVELYAPFETPHEELQPSFLEQNIVSPDQGAPPSRIDPAWAALVEILARLENEPYRWPIGRIAFQKIAYFATDRGVPTGFEYRRGSYGPFTPDLKPVISKLMNNGLIREEPLGRMLEVRVGPTYFSARAAFRQALSEWAEPIEEIVDLFTRLRTHDAELAATVHFAWKELRNRTAEPPTETDVLAEVKEWKVRRRPPLSEADVAETIRNLSMLGLIDVRASAELPVDESKLVGSV